MAIYSKTTQGLDELMSDLERFGDRSMPYIKKASDKAAQIVLDKAVSLVPKDTGKLSTLLAVGTQKVKYGKYFYAATVKVKKGAPYYIPLELGHRLVFFGQPTNTYIKPRPFLRPAADQSKDAVVQSVINDLGEAIKELGGAK
jgi:HK97 gp10 family phage protein